MRIDEHKPKTVTRCDGLAKVTTGPGPPFYLRAGELPADRLAPLKNSVQQSAGSAASDLFKLLVLRATRTPTRTSRS